MVALPPTTCPPTGLASAAPAESGIKAVVASSDTPRCRLRTKSCFRTKRPGNDMTQAPLTKVEAVFDAIRGSRDNQS